MPLGGALCRPNAGPARGPAPTSVGERLAGADTPVSPTRPERAAPAVAPVDSRSSTTRLSATSEMIACCHDRLVPVLMILHISAIPRQKRSSCAAHGPLSPGLGGSKRNCSRAAALTVGQMTPDYLLIWQRGAGHPTFGPTLRRRVAMNVWSCARRGAECPGTSVPELARRPPLQPDRLVWAIRTGRVPSGDAGGRHWRALRVSHPTFGPTLRHPTLIASRAICLESLANLDPCRYNIVEQKFSIIRGK